jgi:hypothetical protein
MDGEYQHRKIPTSEGLQANIRGLGDPVGQTISSAVEVVPRLVMTPADPHHLRQAQILRRCQIYGSSAPWTRASDRDPAATA